MEGIPKEFSKFKKSCLKYWKHASTYPNVTPMNPTPIMLHYVEIDIQNRLKDEHYSSK